MKILFVLHDLSLTGAPKLGLQIAEKFSETHDVILVSKKDGALSKQVNRHKIKEFIVTDTSHEVKDTPLDDRVDAALKVIRQKKPDLVYVNSIAAADWVPAAAEAGCRVVLHIHEMKREIMALLARRIFRPEDVSLADYIVGASEESLADSIDIFRFDSNKSENFSVCVDIDAVKHLAAQEITRVPTRFDGVELTNEHKIVAMCGLACARKGSDLFYTAAKLTPNVNFLWIGPWDDEIAASSNTALPMNAREPLPNLYWTNSTANPYAYMAQANLFFLTSREDPNPLVIPEALLLGLPTASFTACGGAHIWTRQFGYALSGKTEATRIAMFIERFFKFDDFEVSKNCESELMPLLDLQAKAKKLLDTINDRVMAQA